MTALILCLLWPLWLPLALACVAGALLVMALVSELIFWS